MEDLYNTYKEQGNGFYQIFKDTDGIMKKIMVLKHGSVVIFGLFNEDTKELIEETSVKVNFVNNTPHLNAATKSLLKAIVKDRAE